MRDPVLDDARLGQEDDLEALNAVVVWQGELIAAQRAQIAALRRRIAAGSVPADGGGVDA